MEGFVMLQKLSDDLCQTMGVTNIPVHQALQYKSCFILNRNVYSNSKFFFFKIKWSEFSSIFKLVTLIKSWWFFFKCLLILFLFIHLHICIDNPNTYNGLWILLPAPWCLLHLDKSLSLQIWSLEALLGRNYPKLPPLQHVLKNYQIIT